MRRFPLLFSIIVFSIASLCAGEAKKHSPEFDEFSLVLLVRPTNAPELPKEKLEKLQEGHMSNMKALHAEGNYSKPAWSKIFPAEMFAAFSCSRPIHRKKRANGSRTIR